MGKRKSLYGNAFRLVKEYRDGQLEDIEIIIRDNNDNEWTSFNVYFVENGMVDARLIEQIDILNNSFYKQLKTEVVNIDDNHQDDSIDKEQANVNN